MKLNPLSNLSDKEVLEYICKLRVGELSVRQIKRLRRTLLQRHNEGTIQTHLEEIALNAFIQHTRIDKENKIAHIDRYKIQAHLLASDRAHELCSQK